MSQLLALVTEAFGGRGGIGQAARDLIAAFAAQESITAVDVLPRQISDPVISLPPKVRQRGAVAARARYAVAALRVAIRRRPDLVFCNHLYMAPLALLAARASGAKLIVQLHGIEIWNAPSAAQRRALESADLVLCVSRDTRARALGHVDMEPERAIVLNNTVGAQFTPGNREKARAKFQLGNAFTLLSVGRLDSRERYKGQDRVIASLAAIGKSAGREVLYLVAGDGDDRERLEAVTRAASVSDSVRFLGRVPVEELPDLYRAADLFVLPSSGEGFGIVFLEALACGTPALGLAVGGTPDALCDGELGIMIPSEAELSDAITKFVLNPPDRADIPSQVTKRFGVEAFEKRVAQAIAMVQEPS